MWSILNLLNAAAYIQTAHLDQFWQVNSLLKWQRQKCGVAWGGSRLHQMNRLVMDTEETGRFSHFLFASPPFLSLCSSHLSSHLSVVTCLDIFSLSALYSALLSPQQGTVQIKPDKGLLSTNMWWSRAAALTLRRWGTLLRWVPHQMQDFH